MVSVRPSGWMAWVVHPDTDRVLPAEVLDDPQITPSLNTLPTIRIPVPTADVWQTLAGEPAMHVYKDGAEQPIDELTKPRDPRGRAAMVLEGRGGVELLEVTQQEFDSTKRHTAAEQLIDNNTSYDSDVPTPTFETLDGETMQDVSTESEFNDVVTIADDVPAAVRASDEYELTQSGWFEEAETISPGGWDTISDFDANVSNDEAIRAGANESDMDFDFTTEHDIPAANFDVRFRFRFSDDNQPAFTVELDNSEIDSFNRNTLSANETEFGWEQTVLASNLPDPVPAGSHTITFSPDEDIGDDNDQMYIDCVAVVDDRWSHTFDETTDANDALDGPELYPDAVEVEFDDATSAFAVVRGGISLTIDDTGKSQRVQLSNDRGSNWVPTNGDEDNTDSLSDVSFASASDRIRMRLRLSGYEPGTRTETPTQRYDTQTVSDYELTADIEQTSLLLDYSEEQSLQDHLTDIVGDEFFWSYRIVDGTKTVSVLQPDARTAADAPQAINAEVSKDLETYHEFTVRGANKRVTDEQFTASATFQNLTESNIRPASESVTDSGGTNYVRGEDYELNWQAGEIRTLTGSDMTNGNTFTITYRHDVQGTHTDPNAPSGYRSRTVDIPAVTSARNAEQIAYVLVEIDGFNAARWIADLTVPPGVTTFDAVEALPLDRLDLPSGAGPLEIEEPPVVTPEGTAFRLGTRPELESRLADLRRTTRQVARRSG